MKKFILVILVAGLVAVGFAYAAANTVPVTGAAMEPILLQVIKLLVSITI
jgi:predicted small secreted protein